MSEFTNAVVRGAHRVHHTDKDGAEVVSTKADGVVKIPTAEFTELEALGSVRKSTKADRDAPLSSAPPELVAAPTVEEIAGYTPKHRGGGRWDVVNGEVSVAHDFDSKDAAQAWIAEQGKALSEEG